MRLAVLALPALLVACATASGLTRGIEVARGATFDLLPPASLGRSISLEQVVTARHGEHVWSLHCVLEVEPRELRLVGLTPFDTPAFTARLDEHGLHVESHAGNELPADPRQILADLQLALWPALPTLAGLEVVERREGSGSVRELRRGSETVVRIRRGPGLPWESTLEFEHLERSYVLTVETLRSETLTP